MNNIFYINWCCGGSAFHCRLFRTEVAPEPREGLPDIFFKTLS